MQPRQWWWRVDLGGFLVWNIESLVAREMAHWGRLQKYINLVYSTHAGTWTDLTYRAIKSQVFSLQVFDLSIRPPTPANALPKSLVQHRCFPGSHHSLASVPVLEVSPLLLPLSQYMTMHWSQTLSSLQSMAVECVSLAGGRAGTASQIVKVLGRKRLQPF